jgi:uncharacterized repeat protein (TIGR01451 family)
MIQNEKLEFIMIAAIAVLVLLAVMPAGVAAVTLFEDNLENLNNWTVNGDVDVTNDPTYAPSWGGYYARFSGGNTTPDLISSTIDTTCMKNIRLIFALRTVNLSVSDEYLDVQFNDSSGWQSLLTYTDNLSWDNIYFNLPDDKPNLRIRFTLENADLGEYAFLDNVTVTGTPMLPALEVNKTVLDPVTGNWVKELNASIGDILRFKCTMHNSGEVNLTDVRFWDILDCSLNYSGNATLTNASGVEEEIPTPPCPLSYCFKPQVLHPYNLSWNPYDPCLWTDKFVELCPDTGHNHTLVQWKDNGDDRISAYDQIWLQSYCEWYHVENVPYTLLVNKTETGESMYIESVLDYESVTLSAPNGTELREVCGCKDRYTLIDWQDIANTNGHLSVGDLVTLRNERTGEEVQYTVEEVTFDLVVSKEWQIDWLPDPFMRRILEPSQSITIEYNATVVRCGVDTNTFVAKGVGCGNNWTYSEPDVVTITVPCPDGDAADDTPAIKDVYNAGEPVYAMGSNFAPNTLVDIYIFNDRKWLGGEDLMTIAPLYASALGVPVDNNGDIGINPLVLVWANSRPGEYDMVFDANQNQIYEPFIDAVDDLNHPGFVVLAAEVPAFTSAGLIALVGLLSAIAAVAIVRKRR